MKTISGGQSYLNPQVFLEFLTNSKPFATVARIHALFSHQTVLTFSHTELQNQEYMITLTQTTQDSSKGSTVAAVIEIYQLARRVYDYALAHFFLYPPKQSRSARYRYKTKKGLASSVVISRNGMCLRDTLKLNSTLQDHPLTQSSDFTPEDILPWRLARRTMIPAAGV